MQRSAPGRVLGCTRSLAPDVRCSINTVLLGICVCVVAESCIQKGQAYTHWAIPLETMAASLQQLLANRNAWSQAIKLELFEGQKNIFGAEATRKKDFALITGAITPVPLYEFELRELFVEATVKSGCRWWCRRSEPSKASKRVRQTLWSVDMLCRHFEKHYDKQGVDDTRTARHGVRCSCPAGRTWKTLQLFQKPTKLMQKL